MIKFFRNIRQRMLTENKPTYRERRFTKYFLYAIGEIVLVVIGILIALQINNWNIEQQNLVKEIGILEELKKGLHTDKILLQDALARHNEDAVLLEQLDSLLNIPNYQFTKDLNILFGKVYGLRFDRLNSAFYEDLKSTGLQIISDENLRVGIVNLFEINYKLINGYLENERSVNQVTRPYYLQNFTDINFQESANPIDYQNIWTDPYFKNIVHYRIITLQFNQLKEYRNTIDAINAVVKRIDLYLELKN